MKNPINHSIIQSFKLTYFKLAKINDSPQKIALGLGLGVSLGIIPGTGPLAALFLAWILRLNRAAALIGSLLTNTWLSLVTFVLAVKIGSRLTGVGWQGVYQKKAILPIFLGYLAISLAIGLLTYIVTLVILILKKPCQTPVK